MQFEQQEQQGNFLHTYTHAPFCSRWRDAMMTPEEHSKFLPMAGFAVLPSLTTMLSLVPGFV